MVHKAKFVLVFGTGLRQPPGPVWSRRGVGRTRGSGSEEDRPDVSPVEDHEQQTVWRLLPEQLRVLHGTVQVSRRHLPNPPLRACSHIQASGGLKTSQKANEHHSAVYLGAVKLLLGMLCYANVLVL